MDMHKLSMSDVEKIVILNDELKRFFYEIFKTIVYFIDEDEPIINAVSINFIYNNYNFDLYSDNEMRKISINNKNTHNYEFYYEDHEKILIDKCGLKNVSIDEMYDFLINLHQYILFKNQKL